MGTLVNMRLPKLPIHLTMPKRPPTVAPSVWLISFWALLLVTLYLSLVPVQHLPQDLSFWDKAEHAIAFAALVISALLAYPNRMRAILVGLILLGAGIELAQALSGWRQGDWMDWLADCVGLSLGTLAMRLWQARFRQMC